MTDQQQTEKPSEWKYVRPKGEPAFWSRPALPDDLDGYDPLTGCVIAHSEAERDRLTRGASHV